MIVAVPALTPVITPVIGSIVAIPKEPEVHEPPTSPFEVKVELPATQIA